MSKRYPKHVVDLANGGIFKRVVAKQFHYTEALREQAVKAVDEISPADMARHNAIKDKRGAYLGGTPKKSSRTGRDVLKRMNGEKPRKVRGWDPEHPNELADVEIRGSDGKWYKLADCDMGHVPIDAVAYWNNVGRFHGPKSQEVRDWMLDADNYEIQPRDLNQGDRRIMGNSGMGYQPPVTLPDGMDIKDFEQDVLDDLKDFKGEPVDAPD